MTELDPELLALALAEHEGRYDDALRQVLALFNGILADEGLARRHLFITMFEWGQLIEVHAPAREALVRACDDQTERLLAGDDDFRSGGGYPHTRFQLIAKMNKDLDEPHATRDLFVRLEALAPALAGRRAGIALPAIVAAGDFARAERYLPRDPLGRLPELNCQARSLPLFPEGRSAPRLAAELSNFMREIVLCATTFDGLGRDAEAQALRDAALAGLMDAAMRTWAARELAEPGAILRELSARRMAQDDLEQQAAQDQSPPG